MWCFATSFYLPHSGFKRSTDPQSEWRTRNNNRLWESTVIIDYHEGAMWTLLRVVGRARG